MNYLVTHYKNLAEQLQSRINHIQQCLYEMDKEAGGGIDRLRVSDMTQNSVNYNNNFTNTIGASSTPTYPTAPKGPYREPRDVDPKRWGIRIDPITGKPIPPVPVTDAWRRAAAAYLAAVEAYQGYQRSQSGEGIYKTREPRNR
jgi:hypothetical protein